MAQQPSRPTFKKRLTTMVLAISALLATGFFSGIGEETASRLLEFLFG
jgi:hypothetical protein